MPERKLNILLLEAFYGGSHKAWADTLVRSSCHNIRLYTLPDRFWKWRMHGAAVSFAERFRKEQPKADLILCSEMLDLAAFKGLSGYTGKTAVYFHENQLTYPWSPDDADIQKGRDRHYQFLNYTTALAADRVFFNSSYHLNSFLEALPEFLKAFPDAKNIHTIEAVRQKSEVLPLLLDLKGLIHEGKQISLSRKEKRQDHSKEKVPVILWNHRREYDKDPETFFELLNFLKEKGQTFRLCLLGEKYKRQPGVFKAAEKTFRAEIIHNDYAESRGEYAALLREADFMPVTSRQDFFGISVIEGIASGVYPLLPQRLAFPEHLPEELHDRFFYENKEELFKKSLRILKRITLGIEVPEISEAVKAVMRYDLKEMISIYDEKVFSLD